MFLDVYQRLTIPKEQSPDVYFFLLLFALCPIQNNRWIYYRLHRIRKQNSRWIYYIVERFFFLLLFALYPIQNSRWI